MNEGEMLTHMGLDAMRWADEWCRIAREIETADDGRTVIDKGWMVGWFANAIEAGRSAGRRETCPHPDVFVYDDLRLCNVCGKNASTPDEVNERATGVAAAADTAVSGRSEHRSPSGYVAPAAENESPSAPDEANGVQRRSLDVAAAIAARNRTRPYGERIRCAPDEVNEVHDAQG